MITTYTDVYVVKPQASNLRVGDVFVDGPLDRCVIELASSEESSPKMRVGFSDGSVGFYELTERIPVYRYRTDQH